MSKAIRDVKRDSGTESANGGWLRRLVRRHFHLSNLQLKSDNKNYSSDNQGINSPNYAAAHRITSGKLHIWLSAFGPRCANQTPDGIKQKQSSNKTQKRSRESVDAVTQQPKYHKYDVSKWAHKT
jgi:hypothetical protein